MEAAETDRTTVNEIREYLVNKLYQKYGYCGIAEGDKKIMLNSGDSNIVIKIEMD